MCARSFAIKSTESNLIRSRTLGCRFETVMRVNPPPLSQYPSQVGVVGVGLVEGGVVEGGAEEEAKTEAKTEAKAEEGGGAKVEEGEVKGAGGMEVAKDEQHRGHTSFSSH